MSRSRRESLLRIPPFPGARPGEFARLAGRRVDVDNAELQGAIDALVRLRVGGTFWAARPPLPPSYTLIATRSPHDLERALNDTRSDHPIVIWNTSSSELRSRREQGRIVVSGPCDPWHMLDGADAAVLEPESELSLLAGLTGVAVQVTPEQAELRSSVSSVAAPSNLTTAICDYTYWNPFTGEPMSLLEAVELLGFWKRLIDGNRDIGSALGFAFWKQPTVAPLLWGGLGPVPFDARPRPVQPGKSIAIWKSRVARRALVEIEKYGAQLVEVEDGFIRSTGLGADCVPPLSIVVDRLGVHFDPSAPSELEELLEKGMFAPELLTRARALRKIIVDLSVSKYESGRAQAQSRRSARRHILVPGQVEDDRAVLSAKEVIVNAELLRRVRRDAPDAYIIYKPHPDVEAGHRLGGIPDDLLSQLADEVVRDKGITSWIEMVDEVHVNTSLAGFEALLRGKAVTTHGMPFYAGWGLTRDLAEVPQRRTASRSLDELVAAVLLLYPRYVDPVTGLPCPPEILIRRLSEGSGPAPNGAIVQMRRLQGRFKRRVAAMRFW